MKFYLTLVFGASCLCATICARFAYEKGNCEISISSVIQDMLKNEMRALIDPTLRYSSNKRVRYDLYTQRNPYKRQILKTGDTDGLRNSYFNAKWPVRFSIHGWTGKGKSCSNAAIKDAYLTRGNFNVIIVDWSEHSLDISYSRISMQLADIAANFVKFVNFLHRETGVAYEAMYLIGHSAGSHVSGLSGKLLKPNSFGAIFALDPAGLSQLGLSEQYRLAPSDANYVESIHTDITLLGNPSAELSQVSFFVNWGLGQPHCPNATAAEFDFACDHFSALYYFAESVRNPKMFGALRCKNKLSIEKFSCGCANGANACSADLFMGGEPAVPKTNGCYYLSTLNRPPFGMGEMVRTRKVINPNFIQSSYLRKRVFDSIYHGA